jgi:cytochrome c-type biogenesis protein
MGDLLTAFALGMGATITPCILPLYPAFLAYLTGERGAGTDPRGTATRRARRVAPIVAAALVWLGVIVGMVLIGALFAALRAPLSQFIRILLPLADGLLVALGVLLLAGINPFGRLPQVTPSVAGRWGPAAGPFAFGLLFAPIALPCSGPVLVAIFAFSLTVTDVVEQLVTFVAFGIGFGLPLFALGTVSQLRGAQLARGLVRWERLLQLLIGAALVLIGLWDLSVNLPALVGG